jgi:hypothetical protein
MCETVPDLRKNKEEPFRFGDSRSFLIQILNRESLMWATHNESHSCQLPGSSSHVGQVRYSYGWIPQYCSAILIPTETGKGAPYDYRSPHPPQRFLWQP